MSDEKVVQFELPKCVVCDGNDWISFSGSWKNHSDKEVWNFTSNCSCGHNQVVRKIEPLK